MVHNLEKNVKGCFKRRVSITLAMLTIFAITGSVGFAEILKENYEKKDFGPLPTVSGPTRGNVATAFNKTNTQVNSNTVTIDVHSEELLKHNKAIEENKKAIEENKKAIEENKDAIQTEMAERVKADLANENAIKKEAEIRHQVDQVLGERITDNKKAIDAEVERSKAADVKHDEGIAANKKAIEDEVARSKAKDDEHDKGITANKEAIDAEVARSTAEDLKHDKGIADNKKAIEELRRDSEAGIASVAAMSVLDFKGAPVGRVGIGAAIGGYRGKQAVAVGMAFAPSENLNFTGKVGLSTDDIRNSAYGVGVNYFF